MAVIKTWHEPTKAHKVIGVTKDGTRPGAACSCTFGDCRRERSLALERADHAAYRYDTLYLLRGIYRVSYKSKNQKT